MLKCTIIGYVGRAKFSQSKEVKVLTATVAANQKQGEKVYTNWVTLKLWGERAEKLKDIVKKGRKVYAEGRPEAEPYTTRAGKPAANQVIHVDGDFFLLDPKPQEEKTKASKKAGKE